VHVRGRARPALICSLMIADSFFLGGISVPSCVVVELRAGWVTRGL
jgi:hypothetical protein